MYLISPFRSDTELWQPLQKFPLKHRSCFNAAFILKFFLGSYRGEEVKSQKQTPDLPKNNTSSKPQRFSSFMQ